MALSLLVMMLLKLNVLFHILLLFHHPFGNSVQPSCHEKERNALIHFNESYEIDCRLRPDHYQLHPTTSTWGSNGTDCCLWDGVECDMVTGHVIGLNLDGSCLYGSINSNSTLFHLVHLQKLDLGYNNFTFSPIPTAIGTLSKLQFLHLGSSFFQGEIPSEISLLSKLTHLDLSYNVGGNGPVLVSLLKINPNVRSLFQNLTALDSLFLTSVHITYELSESLTNLTSLTHLGLGSCGLYGPLPPSLGKLTQLNWLNLKENDFTGYIPSSFQNLTKLSFIKIAGNQISGPIPSWFGNISELTFMGFFSNSLSGTVPPSLSKLSNLETLDLGENILSGTLQLDSFLKLRNLTELYLGFNMISLLIDETKIDPNTTLSKFYSLAFANCNLSKFPEFIGHQTNLVLLDLSYNNIVGQIPQTLMSIQTLEAIYLSNNWITGFHNHTIKLPWSSLRMLEMQDNSLQGQLPIPPSSIKHYDVSNNLTGLIPRGNQFQTFENSFEGNQGLCGEPLLKKCENMMLPPPSALNKNVDSDSPIEIDWNFVLAGLVSGFVIGVSLGEIVIPRTRLAWLIYFSRTRLREMMIRG